MEKMEEKITQQEVQIWLASIGVNTPMDNWNLSNRAIVKAIYVDYLYGRKQIFKLENLMAEVRVRLIREIGFSSLKNVYYDWRGIVFDTPQENLKPRYREFWDICAHYGVSDEKQLKRDENNQINLKANDYFKKIKRT